MCVKTPYGLVLLARCVDFRRHLYNSSSVQFVHETEYKFTFIAKFNIFNTFCRAIIIIDMLYFKKIRRNAMQKHIVAKTEYALSLIRQGEEEGVDILYRCMAGGMLVAARGIVKDASLAEDVVQESFVKITASVAAYKAGSNPCAWIYRIVRNTALNYLKKYGADMKSDDQFDAIVSESSFEEQSDARILVKQLLSALDPADAEMIYMKYFLEMTVREIARELSVSKSYVSKRIIEAERFMRDKMNIG